MRLALFFCCLYSARQDRIRPFCLRFIEEYFGFQFVGIRDLEEDGLNVDAIVLFNLRFCVCTLADADNDV